MCCRIVYFQKVFPNVEVVIFYIDSLFRAGPDALPAKEAFGYVVSDRKVDWFCGSCDALMEAFERSTVLHKIVYGLASSPVR